jgi:hypothetical protein
MARGSPTGLALGPGYLFAAPLGTAEVTDLTTPGVPGWTAISAAWLALGYTEAGSEFDYALNVDQVLVAEELDPVVNTTTGRTSTVTFNLSQLTRTNLNIAMNGGVFASGSGYVSIEPPDLGTEVRTMLGFESEDHTERWIYRQCIQAGTMKITRAKGAANATIACTFNLEKPATGSRLFKAILSTARA